MTVEDWEGLLRQAARAHHAAFIATDGADPDWPDWYAGWLLDRLSPDAGPGREELGRLLVEAEAAHATAGAAEEWPAFYARFVTSRL
ncbi:MAG: hypothetical protein ACT4OP_06345 [Actinomycetota bacterium]